MERVPELNPVPEQRKESVAGYDEETFLEFQAEVLNEFYSSLSIDERELYFSGAAEGIADWVSIKKNAEALRYVVAQYLEEGGDVQQIAVVVEALKEHLQAMLELH